MQPDYETYAQWFRKHLRKLRRDREWSQGKVAEQAGMTLQHYQKIEYGSIANPGLASLYALACALNVTLGELLDRPEGEK